MNDEYFQADISKYIWDLKYRYRDVNVIHDKTIEDTWHRIAKSLARIEKKDCESWEKKFYNILEGFKFIPGGRIQAGAGTKHRVTLFNCFVMGIVHDSIEGIFNSLKEGALTMQYGGGVGYDFSTLRPRGSHAKSTGTTASGPVSFMQIWDAMCATLIATGTRRGAMMAALRCDHPDIEEFINAKIDSGVLTHFNLSILITKEFINAVKKNEDWKLVFPVSEISDAGQSDSDIVMRQWSGSTGPVLCKVASIINARSLWGKIMHNTYNHAEPGILFIDRINQQNNLWYKEYISATNPCGEIPLPPYGACNLGAVNLTRFVYKPFSEDAYIDLKNIEKTVSIAVRMLDNVIDASLFPLAKQKEQALNCRRIGLGLTGLADALIMLGLHYDSNAARGMAEKIMKSICYTAYRSSIDLAKEKGSFPYLEKEKYINGNFIKILPNNIKDGICKNGIRNSHLVTIAPTGTTSILANNISSGIEPVFDFSYRREIIGADGHKNIYSLNDYSYSLWRSMNNEKKPLPEQFINAKNLSPLGHLKMQSVLQKYIDNAISKTINVPENYSFGNFKSLYMKAYEYKLKGCTTYRNNPITGSVLS